MQKLDPPDVAEKSKLPEPGYLNTAAAAHHLGLSESFLNKLRMGDNGPNFVKISRRVVRYRQDDLDAWMAGQLVTQAPPEAA